MHTPVHLPWLLNVVLYLLIVSFAWWIFSTYVLPKVPEPFRTFITVVLAIAAIIFLLSLVGLVSL